MKSIPAAIIFGGGEGGGSGTGSYTDLTHKPKINGVELSGNKSASDLGLYSKTEVDDLLDDKADSTDVYTKTETDDLLDDKVNKVEGKGLSTNDYDNTAKGIVDGATAALALKADANDVNANWQGNGYNLIPYPYYDGMSKTYNGITYTVNSDGSITANGTSTGNATFVLIDPIVLSSGKYRLSGCPQNGGTTKYEVQLTDGTTAYRDYGNGVEIENADLSYHIILVIRTGFVANNLTFKPMLVKVSDDGTYPTEYQRYADGNVELTDKVSNIQEPTVTWENCTPLSEGTSFQAKNGVAYLSAHLNNVSISANTWKSFGTIPEGFRPNKPDIRFPVLIDGTTKACKGHITSTGVIGIYSSEAITESSSAFVFNLSYIIN